MLVRILFAISAVVLTVAGVAYLAVPGLALGIVAIPSTPANEFLLRTEGVALLFGAGMVWVLRDADVRARRFGLLALAGYYVLSSVVDLAAFAQGIVGPASVPSAVIRIAVGAICLGAVWTGGQKPSP